MSVDFEQVYRKYYTPVYRYLVSLTKDPDLAEEITQETFFKALRNIHTYDPSQKMLTWLCAIGKNTYYSEQKRRHRLTAPDETVPSEDDIVERLLDRENNTAILKIVHRLAEPYKEVFTLRVFGELSFKQIGEVFGKTEIWARVTFYRSKSKIKEEMENDPL